MIGRPLREGVEGGAGFFHLDGTSTAHGRIVREGMVEIRSTELGDELLEIPALGGGEDVGLTRRALALRQRQTFGLGNRFILGLIHLVDGPQDACIGQVCDVGVVAARCFHFSGPPRAPGI
ncbi:MAG: hypothetical protein ACK4F5_17355 [Aliihoeflea sp.]